MKEYITQVDAAKQLGVTRATLYYYMRTLEIEKHKFPLDKHVYLAIADFERIKALKAGAIERGGQKQKDDTDPDLRRVKKDAA